MTDGSQWDVPVSVIAKNREEGYRKLGSHDLSDPDNEDLLADWFEKNADVSDIADWASNNMNWIDVAEVAVQVASATPPDFEEGWMHGEKAVVEK
jgi:hypothetical protein